MHHVSWPLVKKLAHPHLFGNDRLLFIGEGFHEDESIVELTESLGGRVSLSYDIL